MKHKIFSHTSLLIILSVILTFLAAGTVMYNRYDIYMKQGVRDEAAYIKTGLEEDGDVFLSDRVGDATSSRITLLGKDGQVLFDSIENPEEMENHSNRPEFIEAEKQGSGEMVRYSDTLSKQTFYYAVKLKDDQVLRVARTTDSLLVTMLTSFLLLGGLVCVILVIELFLVQKQTRKLIEPINRIDLEQECRICTFMYAPPTIPEPMLQIRFPFREFGRQTADLMHRLLAEPELPPEHIVFDADYQYQLIQQK